MSARNGSILEKSADAAPRSLRAIRSCWVFVRRRCLGTLAGSICVLLALSLLIPPLAVADGQFFAFSPTSSLEPLAVNEQRAVIAHKDGMQRMFIAVNLENPPSSEDPSRSAVWIFPVPGSPDRADVDVTAFFPEFTGHDVKREFDNLIKVARWAPIITQAHFLLLGLATRFPFSAGRQVSPEVTTHKDIDRWGIHAELISADSVVGLADYLRKKKVDVVEERLRSFALYLSDRYVLVVAWISSYEEVLRSFPEYNAKEAAKRPSLYVEFPTEKPFFPMRPTSAYGKNRIEVSLYLAGSLTVNTSSWTTSEKKAMKAHVTYHTGDKEALETSYRAFLSSQSQDRKVTSEKSERVGRRKAIEKFKTALPEGQYPFTRVYISAPAENFTQDLWFVPSLRGRIMLLVVSSPWVLAPGAILLLLGLSFLSGGISGALVFREWRPWARTGLWNCLTIVGLVIATWLKRKSVDHHTTQSTDAVGKPVRLALSVLTCQSATLLVLSFPFHEAARDSFSAVGFAWFGLVFVELLMASCIVWLGNPAAISMKPRFSPAWPCAIAVLLPSIGVLAVIAAKLLPSIPSSYSNNKVNYLSESLPAVIAVGMIVILGLLNRTRVQRFADEMTYKSALSAMLCVLGALSYVAVPISIVMILAGLRPDGGAVAALALLLGTWLIWRELNEGFTKTLRFGVLFSVVFAILTIVAAVLLEMLAALVKA